MVESTELYDILELDPGCSSSDIKKAYRKMAMQHHPDKNPGASHEKFQAIQGAYEILSDAEQRETYDQYGLSGVNGGNGMDGEAFDVNDLFASMFGGGPAGFGFSHHSHSHSHGGHKQQKKARGDDQIVEFNVTLEDAFTGKETTVELEKDIVCTSCKGVGGKKGVKARKCRGCSGKGIVMIERMVGPGMVAMSQTECPDCKGDGETFKSQDKCKKCKGKKTVKSKNRVGVYIEKGARDGDKVVLRGEGEQYPDQKPGDVVLILTVEDHDTITLDKKNNNLFTEVTLTLSEALLGFDRLLLTHLDGRGIRVNQPAPGQPGYKVFSTGDVVKVEGEGFPKRKSPVRGDLFLKFTVTMPTKEEMEALASKHLAYLMKALPPKLPDVTNPAMTDEVELVSVDESEWKDEEDEEDGPSHSYGTNASFDYGSDGSPQPQCAHQ